MDGQSAPSNNSKQQPGLWRQFHGFGGLTSSVQNGVCMNACENDQHGQKQRTMAWMATDSNQLDMADGNKRSNGQQDVDNLRTALKRSWRTTGWPAAKQLLDSDNIN